MDLWTFKCHKLSAITRLLGAKSTGPVCMVLSAGGAPLMRESPCALLGTKWTGWNDFYGLDESLHNPLGTTLSAYRPFLEDGELRLTARIWNIDAC